MKFSFIFSLATMAVLLCSPTGVLAKSKGKSKSKKNSGVGALRGITPSQQGFVNNYNNANTAGDREGDSSTGGQAMESNVATFSSEPRILDVVVSYGADPQDVDWNLFNMAKPGIPVLWSSFNQVTEPGVVVKRAPNLRPGRYRLIMSNLKGQGISGGAGWVKIVNATGTEQWETSTAIPTRDEEGAVYMHDGGFGPRLDEQFDLF